MKKKNKKSAFCFTGERYQWCILVLTWLKSQRKSPSVLFCGECYLIILGTALKKTLSLFMKPYNTALFHIQVTYVHLNGVWGGPLWSHLNFVTHYKGTEDSTCGFLSAFLLFLFLLHLQTFLSSSVIANQPITSVVNTGCVVVKH